MKIISLSFFFPKLFKVKPQGKCNTARYNSDMFTRNLQNETWVRLVVNI